MTGVAANDDEKSPPLAELRGELHFVGGRDDGLARDGVVFDPVRQRYFQLDARTAELLSLWPECETAAQLAAASRERFGLPASVEQIQQLERFLVVNELTVPRSDADWRRLVAVERGGRKGVVSWLVHNYLFIQVPLIDPKRLLQILAPIAAPLYTRAAAITLVFIAATGIYPASRQWDAFLATFPHMFSMQGAILYACALAIVKTFHEFGHAVTAHRYGCRVPSMGICFMVLVPMLYSDVTDAWRLRSRRQRLAIGAAGLIAETGLASIATLLWAFLPEGPERSIAFAVATTSWVLSLGLNLNPLMRFDGYYLLADAVRVENLQPRAFAIGTWLLREFLFGLGAPPPEAFAHRKLRLLATYAYAVWMYRLVVFSGIAVLVYSMSFKLLGIALFAIEIIFFIALPVVREFGAWNRMRASILKKPRTRITVGVAAVLIVATLVPWSTRIVIPAIVEDEQIQRIFPKRAAQVVAVHGTAGDLVKAGDIIIKLRLPELEHEVERTRLAIRAVRLRLDRRSADMEDKAQSIVLEDNLVSLKSKLDGLIAESGELSIVAEHDGRIAEIDRHVVAGRWLQRNHPIAIITGGSALLVRGYLSELDLGRLGSATAARFVPEDPMRQSVDVTLESVAAVGSENMDIQELSSHYGGGVAARTQQRNDKGRVQVSLQGQFLVAGRIVGIDPRPLNRVERGTLHAAGRAESLAERAWRQVLKVLIRESGF